MKKIMFVLLLLSAITGSVCATRLFRSSYEDIAGDVSNVVILKVTRVESIERYRQFYKINDDDDAPEKVQENIQEERSDKNKPENIPEKRRNKPPKKRLLSVTTIVYGTVEENLYGQINKKEIETSYSSSSTESYDDDGNVIMAKSPIRCVSGHEHHPKIGGKYIFSYTSFDEKQINHHRRMDLIEDKDKIMEAIKKKKDK